MAENPDTQQAPGVARFYALQEALYQFGAAASATAVGADPLVLRRHALDLTGLLLSDIAFFSRIAVANSQEAVKPPLIYVVFDGPPGPESGRFVETEDGAGRGVGHAEVKWRQREDGYWTLGPFVAAYDVGLEHREEENG